MLLKSLSQLNFRNLLTPRLEFSEDITAIVGQNAAGKSNLLDALYLGCTGDLPSGKIIESVRIGEEEGMQDFTKSLKQLIDDELIDRPTAFAVAPNKDELKMRLKGINVSSPGII